MLHFFFTKMTLSHLKRYLTTKSPSVDFTRRSNYPKVRDYDLYSSIEIRVLQYDCKRLSRIFNPLKICHCKRFVDPDYSAQSVCCSFLLIPGPIQRFFSQLNHTVCLSFSCLPLRHTNKLIIKSFSIVPWIS